MRWWARHASLTYGDINVLLFIILNPLLTLIFMATTLVLANRRVNEKTRRAITWITVALSLLSLLFVAMLIAIPLFYKMQ